MAEAQYQNLPFKEALDYYRSKGLVKSKDWTDLWQDMNARGFTVAGASRDDMLADLFVAVERGLSEGTTIDTFRKDFDQIVSRYGWDYRGERDWRTATIFNTNLSTAYSAGRWKQQTNPEALKERPYLRYVASSSAEPRVEHMVWYNLVLPADDPFWATHYPPNGWGCKCGVVSVSPAELEQLQEEFRGTNFPIRTEAPPPQYREEFVPGLDRNVTVPNGIDPGWDYNPGRAAWGETWATRTADAYRRAVEIDNRLPSDYKLGNLPAVTPAVSPGSTVPVGDVDGLSYAFKKAIGGEQAVFVDPVGDGIIIGQPVVDHILEQPVTRWDGREAFFPLMPELIRDPQEIWVSWVRYEDGQTKIRRRYIKLFDVGKERYLGIWADSIDGCWVAGDVIRGGISGTKNFRKGRLVYAK